MSNNEVFTSADILLPKKRDGADGTSYACVACDQFTSETDFWEECKKRANQKPSAVNMILPEAYLSIEDSFIPGIHASMNEYLEKYLEEFGNSMIYLRRTQPDGRIRKGIVGKIDLEYYNYNSNSDSLIRPTEKTVIERIPARVKIRENASIELPHIMLLINDKMQNIIEPLEDKYSSLKKAYDFELMMNAGHVEGYFLDDVRKRRITTLLARYSTENYCNNLYRVKSKKPLLFAVGDGNHSLASAKAVYEKLKEKHGNDAKNMPARYALVEFVNIHDSALDFEPIYRIVKCSSEEEVSELVRYIKKSAIESNGDNDSYEITVLHQGLEESIEISKPDKNLPVAFLQEHLDNFSEKHPDTVTDYIHGEESLRKLVHEENSVGFLFKGMDKSDLFKSIIKDGVLPRKTFSMGHALDKRHYLEARKIK